MTKKHFEAIAQTIREQADGYPNIEDREVVRSTAIRLAAVFSNDNPFFDPQKFLTACGF